MLISTAFFYRNCLIEKERLSIELSLQSENTTKLNKALALQNEAYEALKVKKSEPPMQKQAIEKIFIKDEGCNAEIKAYKELFKELGR